MSFSKSQGKKQDGSNNNNGHHQKNRNNNNNKKWSNNNNTTRNRASSPSSVAEPIHQDPATTKQLHDRMLFLLGNLTGSLVEATVKDGCKFKGIFHGASTEGDLGIALKLAQKIHDPNTPLEKDKTNPNPIKNTMLIFSNDLVEINAVNVDFTSTETADRNTFKTDTDISGKLDMKERELHKWAPTEEDGNGSGLLEGGLESNDNGSWDQFAANEKLFGLKTDFDEEIYTTTLNRSAPGYKDREKRAIKLANEIQKTTTTNVHMLEERGLATGDSGMDEEDLYGAVVRDTNPNKYVPPALRKLQQQQQQQQQQHHQQPQTQQQQTKKEKGNPLNKLMTSDLPKTSSNASPIANLPTNRRETSEHNNNSGKNNNSGNEPPKRIETEIAITFRNFAIMEKDKLHAKKQALQKKEKDGRLAELKAFHQSFKLNVPIPADLVPLLSKKKTSTDGAGSGSGINKIDSPDSNKKLPVKKGFPPTTATTAPPPPPPPSSTNTTSKKSIVPAASPSPKVSVIPHTPASPAPATATATTDTTAVADTTTTASSPATSNSFKFNVKASSFKPNPSAAAFVPGGGGSTTHNNPSDFPMGMPMATTHMEDNNSHTFLNGRQLKKGGPVEHLTMTEAFVPSFLEKNMPASSVGPTWPFGNKSYRVQFSQFGYDEDVYNYPSPNYSYYPQYRYPFPQMPYPQFVQPPMPPNYSPQMANVSPHGSPFPQGFPSPQRSPMVPQQMPHQIYQYGGAPMMMRYPPDMMMQRPVMVETVPYSPHHQQDTPATDSGTETPPTN